MVRGGYGLFSALNQGSTYYAMRVENGVVQINYNYNGLQEQRRGRGRERPAPRFPTRPALCSIRTCPSCRPAPLSPGRFIPLAAPAPAVAGPTKLGSAELPRSRSQLRSSVTRTKPISRSSRRCPGKMSLTVGYVGTRGMRLPVFVDANLIGQKPSGLRSYNVLDATNNLSSSSRFRSTGPPTAATQRWPPTTPVSALPIPGTTRWR